MVFSAATDDKPGYVFTWPKSPNIIFFKKWCVDFCQNKISGDSKMGQRIYTVLICNRRLHDLLIHFNLILTFFYLLSVSSTKMLLDHVITGTDFLGGAHPTQK